MIRFAAALAALLAVMPLCASAGPASDPYEPQPYVKLTHPDWTKNAVIYQLNTRQFTEEGTFNAAREQLPRIKELGADIVWLMPIHPIGEKNRKGTLGSPYSIKDYYGVNPEFGTLDDLKAFVDEAHRLGLYVILDWVANHTAWDNNLVTEHPDWYERDWKGNFRPTPWWDWSDIIDLDYSKPGVRRYMTEAMAYWVREVGIDGYRCDVAGFVPLDFWVTVRKTLEEIKPVFMLAEWDERDALAEAFDAVYAWDWNNTMHDIAHGRSNAFGLFGFYSGNESTFPAEGYRLMYVSNHDQNSWHGTQFERFGPALEAAITLSVIGEGIPMIYNGQEAGNEKRLEFFEKDPIKWRDHPLGALYKKLFALKKENTALWNGAAGGRMIPVVNTAPEQVFSFVRRSAENKVFALFNFSGETQSVRFEDGPYAGNYKNAFSGKAQTLDEESAISLGPWSYRVLIQK